MSTNIINDGNAVTGSNTPVYYNTSYSTAGLTEYTFQIYGPSGIGEYNPAGTAFVQYFDPLTGSTTVETFAIGGQNGPSEITIQSGSLSPNESIGEVAITIVDNANIPGAGRGAKFLGTLGQVLKALFILDNSIDGVFGVPGYNVSLLDADNTNISFNATYPPGFLESLGISPNSLPQWLSPSYDALGNFVGLDYQSCFLAGTMIDMWPIDLGFQSNIDGIYDQEAVRAKIWKKPIEEVTPNDWVVSFDKQGNLKPGKVTRTMTNEAKVILDFHGTFVTPGHVYYCAGGKYEGGFAPLIDILRDDGVIQHEDGTLIRANTGCEVGSEDDKEFWAFLLYTEEGEDVNRVRAKTKLRLGTRWMQPNGSHFSMREYMDGIGLELLDNGYVRWKETGITSVFAWVLSDTLPEPEDFILARSQTTLEDIYRAGQWEDMRPQMPVPLVMDGGPVQQLSEHKLDMMPRNIPMASHAGPSSSEIMTSRPKMNRKQRKAFEAKMRKAHKSTTTRRNMH